MVIAAIAAFAVLFVAWLVAPAEPTLTVVEGREPEALAEAA